MTNEEIQNALRKVRQRHGADLMFLLDYLRIKLIEDSNANKELHNHSPR